MDIEKLIGAVRREVVTREHEGKLARVVIAERDFSTDIDDLFDAITSAERLPRWFMPVSGELELGGHFQFEGNAGGDITTCDRPDHLGVTWGVHGQTSWVDVYLTALSDAETRLRLEHTAHVPEEFWGQYGPGATGVGWELGLLGLHLHTIDGGASRDDFDEAAWSASPEGRQFVAKSAHGWGEAAIAGGEEPDDAQAAAQRTRQFYTPTQE